VSWNEELDEAIKSTLDDGSMVLRWMAVIETIDAEGVRGVSFIGSPELMAWESLGLLEYALAKEKDAFRARQESEED
jgi:hypothetical protein